MSPTIFIPSHRHSKHNKTMNSAPIGYCIAYISWKLASTSASKVYISYMTSSYQVIRQGVKHGYTISTQQTTQLC